MSSADLLLGREPLDTTIPTARRRKATKPKVSEALVVNAIRSRLALYGCLVQVNPNEARSAVVGRASKIRGTISGFPDLTIISPDGLVAFLEVKAPGAKPTNAKAKEHWARQAEVRATLARMGQTVALVRDQDEACAVLRGAGWAIR